MATAEEIKLDTNSSAIKLAPAVLVMLEEAGAAGLGSGSRISPIADAVCGKFQVVRSSPVARGSRPNSVRPDYYIEWAVTYLVNLGCVLKDGHMRFITAQGRELLKMPLDDIENTVRIMKNAERDKELQLEIKNAMLSLDLDDPEDPGSPEDRDTRERRNRETVIRIGAIPFRSRLMEAYQGRCAITGSEVAQVLQAAHIVPYRGSHTDRLDNGLLLRVDVHQLFDKNLIGIDPVTSKIHIHQELIGTEYEEFDGCQLTGPAVDGQRPSRRRLEKRWKEFLGSCR
jgi:HNH endonuclease